MSKNDPLKSLLEDAKNWSPFGEPRELGFETRLRARMAGLEPGVMDSIATLSWRFALTCLPVLLAVAAFLAMQQQSDFLSSSVGEFVSQWTGYLPVDI